MRNAIAAIVVGGALTLVPAIGVAAPQGQQAMPVAKSSQTKPASHATSGVVKSITAMTLVITRSGKKSGDMTFGLNASTHRDGAIEVGAPVSVRYRDDSDTHIATAITLQHPKQQAAHTAKSPQ